MFWVKLFSGLEVWFLGDFFDLAGSGFGVFVSNLYCPPESELLLWLTLRQLVARLRSPFLKMGAICTYFGSDPHECAECALEENISCIRLMTFSLISAHVSRMYRIRTLSFREAKAFTSMALSISSNPEI